LIALEEFNEETVIRRKRARARARDNSGAIYRGKAKKEKLDGGGASRFHHYRQVAAGPRAINILVNNSRLQ